MKKLFIAIFILTVIDIVCTVTGVQMGFITEANPILQRFMEDMPVVAGFSVLIAVSALLYLIYRYRHKIRWLIYPLSGVVAIKVFIVGIHINWILHL